MPCMNKFDYRQAASEVDEISSRAMMDWIAESWGTVGYQVPGCRQTQHRGQLIEIKRDGGDMEARGKATDEL
jgi:hypothetical protein